MTLIETTTPDQDIPRARVYGVDPETGIVDRVGNLTAIRAIARAAELLLEYPDGIEERPFVNRVAQDMSIPLWIAAAAVDSLESRENVTYTLRTSVLKPKTPR